jgi:hypothetical protein
MTTKNNEKVVVNAAENAELQCKFNGNPAPVTSWTNPNGLKLSDGDTLKFFETKQEDAGFYECVGESSMGMAKAEVQLVVRGPPIILSDQGKCFSLMMWSKISLFVGEISVIIFLFFFEIL